MLSFGQQRLVEIALALAPGPTISLRTNRRPD